MQRILVVLCLVSLISGYAQKSVNAESPTVSTIYLPIVIMAADLPVFDVEKGETFRYVFIFNQGWTVNAGTAAVGMTVEKPSEKARVLVFNTNEIPCGDHKIALDIDRQDRSFILRVNNC